MPPEIRQKMLATSVAAEFPTVDLHTLEALYISLYSQQVSEPNKSLHRFTMRPHTRITKAQPTSSSSSSAESSDSIGKVTLTALDVRSQLPTLLPTPYDLVIASPERTALPGKSLVAPLARMFDSNSPSGQCSVDAGYRVNFRRKAVAPGCGLWVLGTLADAKVRRDDFSLLSASAGRALESILEVAREEEKVEVGGKGYGQMAML
jgi:lysine/ornithine N-monooxygenase